VTENLALKICRISEPVFLTNVHLFSEVFKCVLEEEKFKSISINRSNFENTKMELIHGLTF
jgi:hypothetical protein